MSKTILHLEKTRSKLSDRRLRLPENFRSGFKNIRSKSYTYQKVQTIVSSEINNNRIGQYLLRIGYKMIESEYMTRPRSESKCRPGRFYRSRLRSKKNRQYQFQSEDNHRYRNRPEQDFQYPNRSEENRQYQYGRENNRQHCYGPEENRQYQHGRENNRQNRYGGKIIVSFDMDRKIIANLNMRIIEIIDLDVKRMVDVALDAVVNALVIAKLHVTLISL